MQGIRDLSEAESQELAAALPGLRTLVLRGCCPPFDQVEGLLRAAPITAVCMEDSQHHRDTIYYHEGHQGPLVAADVVDPVSGGEALSKLLFQPTLRRVHLCLPSWPLSLNPVVPGHSNYIALHTLLLPGLILEYSQGTDYLNLLLPAPNLRHLQV
jgi:hypothetical protein